jgi:hypothetical protein
MRGNGPPPFCQPRGASLWRTHQNLHQTARSPFRGNETPPFGKPQWTDIWRFHQNLRHNPRSDTNKKCDHCKKEGHTKDECWFLHPELRLQGQRRQRDTNEGEIKWKRVFLAEAASASGEEESRQRRGEESRQGRGEPSRPFTPDQMQQLMHQFAALLNQKPKETNQRYVFKLSLFIRSMGSGLRCN